MKFCKCGAQARVQTLVTFLSGALEVHWHCEAHARLFRYAANRLGYGVEEPVKEEV